MLNLHNMCTMPMLDTQHLPDGSRAESPGGVLHVWRAAGRQPPICGRCQPARDGGVLRGE